MSPLEYLSRLRWLRTHFRRTFNGPDGKPHEDGRRVLAELRRFCYGAKPTIKVGSSGVVDPYASIAASARQEVYFRVLDLLRLDDSDLVLMEKRVQQQESSDG